MCDGVTQGTPGMELSLFSRDTIAMGTAVALTHDVFDARAAAGHLRQDRAGPADRRAALRPPAVRVRARRADELGPVEQREGQGARAGRAGPGRPRRAAARPSRRPTTRRAPAPSTAPPTATRCCSRRWACTCRARPSSTRTTPMREALTREAVRTVLAHRARRSASLPIGQLVDERVHRQRDGRAAGHRRLDQPPDPLGGGGARGRHPDRLERLRRAVARGAAAGARLSQRQRPT